MPKSFLVIHRGHNKHANPAGSCRMAPRSRHCSTYCHDSGRKMEIACNFGHAGCSQPVVGEPEIYMSGARCPRPLASLKSQSPRGSTCCAKTARPCPNRAKILTTNSAFCAAAGFLRRSGRSSCKPRWRTLPPGSSLFASCLPPTTRSMGLCSVLLVLVKRPVTAEGRMMIAVDPEVGV